MLGNMFKIWPNVKMRGMNRIWTKWRNTNGKAAAMQLQTFLQYASCWLVIFRLALALCNTAITISLSNNRVILSQDDDLARDLNLQLPINIYHLLKILSKMLSQRQWTETAHTLHEDLRIPFVIGSVSNEANYHTHTHTEESRACMYDHNNMTGGLINSGKDSD
jgi:hypothetical protein